MEAKQMSLKIRRQTMFALLQCFGCKLKYSVEQKFYTGVDGFLKDHAGHDTGGFNGV